MDSEMISVKYAYAAFFIGISAGISATGLVFLLWGAA